MHLDSSKTAKPSTTTGTSTGAPKPLVKEVAIAAPVVALRTTRAAVVNDDQSHTSGYEAGDSKRDSQKVDIIEDDESGDDSDEWKPEDHPPPSGDDDDGVDTDTSGKEEEEAEKEEDEDEDGDEEEDEDEEAQEKEKKEQDSHGKDSEGTTST